MTPGQQDVLSREEYFAAYPGLHGGYDPTRASVLVRGWLSLVHRVAVALAGRGVSPDAVTWSAVALAGLAVLAGGAGGPWWPAAGALVVVSGLCDALDGCLAVLTRRTSRWGYVLDSVADRVSDSLFLWALVLLGTPVWLAVLLGCAVFLLEYTRARAGNAGGDAVGRITVGERPVRVVLVALTLLAGGVLAPVAYLLPLGLLGLTAAGLVQLLVAVRRQLAVTS